MSLLSPGVLAAARRGLSHAADSLSLFGRYMELVAGGSRMFVPHGYDFDSIDNRDASAVERVLERLVVPMERFMRADVRGLERAPKGPALFVGNHNGGAWSPEIFLFGGAMYRRQGLDGLPYGLAHEIVSALPLAHLLIPLGAVRASHDNAARIFGRGRNILVYPGGDEEALRKSTRRDQIVFGGRRGYIRLALRHGVPIVPVVTFGGHDVFWVLSEGRWLASALGWEKHLRMKACPIMLSMPWGITLGPIVPFAPWPARVCVEVLDAMHFERSGEAAANDEDYVAECDLAVRTAMQTTLTLLAREHRGVEQAAVHAQTPDNDQTNLHVLRAG